ncbi:hypothetical protein J2T13_000133 [Paenibacillus sp. DS2015]|uniref:hypothetical protein n=1 Tax=Paenibacillus sp. DS2015 TaxID=3373917 RepID=UPI003D1BF963
MLAKEWLEKNYYISDSSAMGRVIVWGNEQGYYGIYTPIIKFIEMFGDAIQNALDNGEDVKQGIRDSDPENLLGFKDLL